jgi:hypothetical protein
MLYELLVGKTPFCDDSHKQARAHRPAAEPGAPCTCTHALCAAGVAEDRFRARRDASWLGPGRRDAGEPPQQRAAGGRARFA